MICARRHPSVVLSIALAAIVWSGASAEEVSTSPGKLQTPEQIHFFETKIRPVLAANCFKCHGEEKQEENLRLDSRAAALAGGDPGPAVVPRQPGGRLLVQASNHLDDPEMPP